MWWDDAAIYLDYLFTTVIVCVWDDAAIYLDYLFTTVIVCVWDDAAIYLDYLFTTVIVCVVGDDLMCWDCVHSELSVMLSKMGCSLKLMESKLKLAVCVSMSTHPLSASS